MHRYDTTKDLRKKAFKTKEENIKQTSGVQMTLLLEIERQKYNFFANYEHFFTRKCVLFQPLLGWQCACACHNVRTEAEDM